MRETLVKLQSRLTQLMGEIDDIRNETRVAIEEGQAIVAGPNDTWPAPSVVNKLDFSLGVLEGLVEITDRCESNLYIGRVNLTNAIDQYPEV